MAWNGSGTFNRLYNWVVDKANGIKITASRMDGEFDNYKTGLENCLTRDGQNSPTADLVMAGHKHTGVAPATASDEYATKGQLDTTTTSVATLQADIEAGTVVAGEAAFAHLSTAASAVNWVGVTSTPTTLSGYGITDATKKGYDAGVGGLYTGGVAYPGGLTNGSSHPHTDFTVLTPPAGTYTVIGLTGDSGVGPLYSIYLLVRTV